MFLTKKEWALVVISAAVMLVFGMKSQDAHAGGWHGGYHHGGSRIGAFAAGVVVGAFIAPPVRYYSYSPPVIYRPAPVYVVRPRVVYEEPVIVHEAPVVIEKTVVKEVPAASCTSHCQGVAHPPEASEETKARLARMRVARLKQELARAQDEAQDRDALESQPDHP